MNNELLSKQSQSKPNKPNPPWASPDNSGRVERVKPTCGEQAQRVEPPCPPFIRRSLPAFCLAGLLAVGEAGW